MISKRVAPSDLRTSISSTSVAEMPAATLIVMGKNERANAVIAAGMVPMPNQRTNTGTIATFGTELKAISNGLKQEFRKGDQPTATPNRKPKTTAPPKPIVVVESV